jgi:hypothetical protein
MSAKGPAVAAPERDEFVGLSLQACCRDCNEGRCVITGIAACGHPYKSALPRICMDRADVLERHGRARHALDLLRVSLKHQPPPLP